MPRDIIFLILGLVIGAFFSWLFTKIYYEKAKRDNDKSIEGLKSHIDKSAENTVKWEEY